MPENVGSAWTWGNISFDDRQHQLKSKATTALMKGNTSSHEQQHQL